MRSEWFLLHNATYFREIGQCPHSPNLAWWCMEARDETKNRLEATVVDISLGFQAPTIHREHQAIQHIYTRRLRNRPCLSAIRRDMSQYASGIIANFNTIACRVEKIRENTWMYSEVMRRCLSCFTSATLPSSPIMFLKSSSLSGKNCDENEKKRTFYDDLSWSRCKHKIPTFKHPRKYSIPRPSKNLSQLIAVSSVTFHIVDHATSMTSSKTLRCSRSLIKVNITDIAPKSPRNNFWLPSTWHANEFNRYIAILWTNVCSVSLTAWRRILTRRSYSKSYGGNNICNDMCLTRRRILTTSFGIENWHRVRQPFLIIAGGLKRIIHTIHI